MKKLMFIMISVCFMLLSIGDTVNAATPRVMVSDYSIDEEKVISGKEFTINITLQNTAKRAIKNAKVSLTTMNGEFIPVKGAGTDYVEQIDAEGEVELPFQMMAISGLEEKSYKLIIKIEYEGSNGIGYTVEEAIFIPVTHEMRISVTDVFLTESNVELGDVVEISAIVNNMGAGKLYNVMAEVTGDNIEPMKTYVGNIEAGKNGMIDILTKASVVTEGDHKKNQIIICYEDQKGNTYEQEVEIMLKVSEPIYENLEKVKEEVEYSEFIKDIIIVILIILAFIGIVFFWIRRKKKKQEMLEEFIN